MLKWISGLFVVVSAGALAAAAYWWLNRPLIIKHPNFGTDCSQLVDQADVNAKVDCVRVWYGTNRMLELAPPTRALDLRDVLDGTGDDAGLLQLGRADVWLPKLIDEGGSRERGTTPHAQGRAPTEADELAKLVFLTRITTHGRRTFSTTLQDAIDAESNALLLFVHGFNVAFDEALVRTAQLSNDLSRNEAYDVGVPVLYSWPSAGEVGLETYHGDRDRSLGSAPHLEAFLDLITEDIDVDRINIIAHSMGNRVLTKALEDYASDYLTRHERDDLEFRILLVAADVERDVFDAANGVFDNLDANVTIYTSDTDRALHVSNIVNQKLRLGDTDTDKPYIRTAQNYQTIDATAVATELFGIGHNYYSDNPTILWDMMCTIGETRPQDRALEVARYGGLPDGDQYYRVNANVAPNSAACGLQRTAFPIGQAPSVPAIDEGAPEPFPTGSPAPAEDATSPPRGLGQPSPPPPPAPEPEPIFEPSAQPVADETVLTFLIEDEADPDLSRFEVQLQSLLDDPREIEAITISAHSDTVGATAENLATTERLAATFRDWFVAEGIDPALISTLSLGEQALEVPTEDEVDLLLNRRVVIEIRYAD